MLKKEMKNPYDWNAWFLQDHIKLEDFSINKDIPTVKTYSIHHKNFNEFKHQISWKILWMSKQIWERFYKDCKWYEKNKNKLSIK